VDDAPAWLADLRKRDGFPARALEFLALTAARSGEIRGATRDEIDLDRALWIVPAQRMKMQREHRVPLTAEAAALLKALPRLDGTSLVFDRATPHLPRRCELQGQPEFNTFHRLCDRIAEGMDISCRP
jgi:integrase